MNSRLEQAIEAFAAMDIEDAEDPRETLALSQRDILREYAPAYARWLDAHPEADEGLFPVEQESADEQRERMAALRPAPDEDIRRWLRILRYRELIRVAVADFSGLDDFAETTRKISQVADVCVQRALDATDLDKEPFAVIAMGKWGGLEVNYSSDIDALFVASDDVDQEALHRLQRQAPKFIRLISDNTGDGFVFRVDMRLRPEGKMGPLVRTVSQYLRFYERYGMNWTFQALIKARFAGGDAAAARALIDGTRRFVFDPERSPETLLREVFEMKQMIEKSLRSKGTEVGNVKLGAGSIRDIEFIVQLLQLYHGAANKSLRSPNTLQAMSRLRAHRVITQDEYDRLREAYIFLRVVEHVLQLERDLPVRQLPREPKQWATFQWRVAFALRQPLDTLDLGGRYEETSAEVRRIFGEFFDETIEFLERKHQVRERCPDLPADVIDEHFRRLESAYFLAHPVEEVARHVELIHELDAERLCRVDVRHVGSTRRVTVVANDYQGEFAKICGLLAAYGQSILSGSSYTYQDAGDMEFYRRPGRAKGRRSTRPGGRRGRQGRRKDQRSRHSTHGPTRIVYSAEVQPAPAHASRVFSWADFERDLNRLLGLLARGDAQRANEELTLRVMEAARLADPGADAEQVMPPISISVDNESDEHCTILEIRSPDSFMFLFEFSNVLSTRDYWIDKVEFDTVEGEVRDRLFVTTRSGGKIEDRIGVDHLRLTVTLMKQFARRLAVAPNPQLALRQFGALIDAACKQVADPTQALASSLDELARVLGAGTWLWEEFLRRQHENLMPLLEGMADLDLGAGREDLEHRLDAALEAQEAPDEALNRFKDDEIGRIDMRHLTRRIERFSDFGEELSTLSDVVLTRAATEAVGETAGDGAEPGVWCLCALGKWGGRDLGYASDVELMFVWDAERSRLARAGEFYERAAQRLARLIRAKRDGIFELDWRLRPGGASSPLAASFQRFVSYYSADGEADPYERQALVRLRTVAGDPDLAARVETHRQEFVFDPRPHDVARIRHLRNRQRSELVTRGTTNAKFSAGGLLDAEYFVQVRQIAAGAGDPEVRQTNTLDALGALHERGHLADEEFEQIGEGYRLLRAVINCLRIVRGHSKDLVIPAADTSEFRFLARRLVSLGQLPDEEGGWDRIAERMAALRRLFDGLSD